MPTESPLIRPMFDGPVDLIGDVHGEIAALEQLLQRLGYDADGRHDDGRRLVFIGDLVDRGPDTPAVLHRVKRMIDHGNAQCIMGNHELNVLRMSRKDDNYWFHHEVKLDPAACAAQRLLPEQERGWVVDFLRSQPLALERDDLRVTHACWDDTAVDRLRTATDALGVFKLSQRHICEQLDSDGIEDPIARNLARQNKCPVKLFTSGREERAAQRFHAGGRARGEARVPWWNDYSGQAFCVFGHYSRTKPESQDGSGIPLFPGDPFTAVGHTMCIDFGVGGRAKQRLKGGIDPSLSLAALRWPEREVCLDDGRHASMQS